MARPFENRLGIQIASEKPVWISNGTNHLKTKILSRFQMVKKFPISRITFRYIYKKEKTI
jgi:hypothetical protein